MVKQIKQLRTLMADIERLIFELTACGIVTCHCSQNFFQEIWDDNVEFIRHLLGDVIKIVLTMIALKLIITIAGWIFAETPSIIEGMEIVSYISIFIIFMIYTIHDIYYIIKKLRKSDAS